MKKVIFSSYASNRLDSFKLSTIIWEDNGVKIVKKNSLTPLAIPHMNQMEHSYFTLKELYKGTSIDIVPCKKEGDGIVFNYVQGNSVEHHLYNTFVNNGADALVLEIEQLFLQLAPVNILKDFVKTPRFVQVFGQVEFSFSPMCLTFSNIDLNFDNLIIHQSKQVTVIDYEWCFDFPVPIRYVFFRAIWAFQEKYNLQALQLFTALEFSSEELSCFKAMDACLNAYIFGSPTFDVCIPGHTFLKRNIHCLSLFSELDKVRADNLILSDTIETLSSVSTAREKWIAKLDKDIAELKEATVVHAAIIEDQQRQLEKKKRLFGR